MRSTNQEIQEAKMLARRLEAVRKSSAPPLSRIRDASRLVWLTSVALVAGTISRTLLKMLGRRICPKCNGAKNQLTHIVHDEFAMRQCRLCEGKGFVTEKQLQAWRYGQAHIRYRASLGYSRSKAYYITGGERPDLIAACEEGLISLHHWPEAMIQNAELQLDREAAGHASTT
jgi:hypothetical protein